MPTHWRSPTCGRRYRVLRGSDPLAGMEVRPADLRAALEREFRGKLMRLRQGYALYGATTEGSQ